MISGRCDQVPTIAQFFPIWAIFVDAYLHEVGNVNVFTPVFSYLEMHIFVGPCSYVSNQGLHPLHEVRKIQSILIHNSG